MGFRNGMDKDKLLALIADDDFELIKARPAQSAATSADERLISAFHEINRFVNEYGREPQPGKGIQEHQLYARLKGIRASKDKIQALMDLDEHMLLEKEVKELQSIKDIFEDDDLGILKSDADRIFNLTHVSKAMDIPDFVAQRKPCKDFGVFKEKFLLCHQELSSGKRKLFPFRSELQIESGRFFVLKGVLIHIAQVGEIKDTKNGRLNARLRCIYENGTESNILLRSLARALYRDGRTVSENEEHFMDGFNNIQADDKEKGFIYILKSLSRDPQITSLEDLYKIGFSTVPVEERIKNASLDPTYLMAPVKIVTAYRCFNINPQKLELLLHKFFGSSCLNIDIIGQDGQRYNPREWFIAPLDIVEEAIHLILSEKVLKYKYDAKNQRIIDL